MIDIALGAEIRREFLPGFLQEINSHGSRVASHSASGTQPHKFNDATGHARCQLQDVVDRDPIVDDTAPVDVHLLEEACRLGSCEDRRLPSKRAGHRIGIDWRFGLPVHLMSKVMVWILPLYPLTGTA
jgi:hypothetical protein